MNSDSKKIKCCSLFFLQTCAFRRASPQTAPFLHPIIIIPITAVGVCVCVCARAWTHDNECRSQKHSKTSAPQFQQTTTGSCIVFPTKKAPSKYVLCGFSGFGKKSLKSGTHVPESLSQFTLLHVLEPIYIPWSLSMETCLHRFAKINTIEK